jgi:molybdopterin synthase sulfur carrier subunit
MRDAATASITVVYSPAFAKRWGRDRADGAGRLPDDRRRVARGVAARGGAWAVELAPERAVRMAVNHAIAGPETVIADGDEVALFPPVTGG